MYNAPAVSYPVGRSAFHGLVLGALVLLAVSTQVLWMWQADRTRLAGLGLLSSLLAAALALRTWWHTPAGGLHWDGARWSLQDRRGERPGQAAVRLDWQTGLLLEFQPDGGRRQWCWLERRSAPADWAALRRAVYAMAPVDHPAAEASASSP